MSEPAKAAKNPVYVAAKATKERHAATRAKGEKTGRPLARKTRPAPRLKAMFLLDAPRSLEGLQWLSKYSPKHEIRLAAFNAILDRGLGRPAQPLVDEEGRGPVQITFMWGGRADHEPLEADSFGKLIQHKD